MYRRGLAALVPTLLAMMVILSACGPTASNDDERRFAIQTEPPIPTETPIPRTGAATPVATPVGTPDTAALFGARGHAGSAFFRIGDQITYLSADGTFSDVPLGGRVVDMSIAPDGSRAAVLIDRGGQRSTPVATPAGTPATPSRSTPIAPGPAHESIVVLDAAGAISREIPNLANLLASIQGSGGATGAPGGFRVIAIGAEPDDLVIGLGDGLLVRVAADGAASAIVGSGNFHDLIDVAWSPVAETLLLLGSTSAEETTGIYTAPVRVDGIDPVRIGPPAGRTATSARWSPDGMSVLYISASGPESAQSIRNGQDLFSQPLRSSRPGLVAASARVGPAVGVTTFDPAPDGTAVLYVVSATNGNEIIFNSLWVVGSDGANASVRIPVPSGLAVVGLSWTTAGAMVAVAPPNDPGAASICRVDARGQLVPMTPAASPSPA